MNNYYIDTNRVYDEGYCPGISPTDGRKYYEDKVGIRSNQYSFDWWIQPLYSKITIELVSSRTVFICETIFNDSKSYSIILDNKNVLYEKITRVQRIEDTDTFVINNGEKNSIIEFLKDGSYKIQESIFHRIFKLQTNLINQIDSIFDEKIKYVGVVKKKSNFNIDSYNYEDFFLDPKFNINSNFQYCYAHSLYERGVILHFKYQERNLIFLYLPNRGIVNKKLSSKIEYLGGSLYRIFSFNNTWDIIDSFGNEYMTDLDSVEKYQGDLATTLIFCKGGQYGAMDISGEIFNIPLSEKLEPHQNSYGAKSGYVQRKSSVFDILGNSFQVSFPSHQSYTTSEFKPVVDDNCFSVHIGGGVYCITSNWRYDRTSVGYSYVVNRHGKIMKEKREGQYLQFFEGLFVFRTNDGIYQIINKEDKIIFTSENEIYLIEIPNFPIISIKREESLNRYSSRYFLELFNLNGERLFENVEYINEAKPFSNGNILLGIKGEVSYDYPVTVPIFDTDEDGNSYCEEYKTYDIATKDITLWGLYSVDGQELIPREYYSVMEDSIFKLIRLSKMCGANRRGFFELFGYADYTGTVLLGPSYESIEIFTDSLLRTKANNRYGLLDYGFKQVIPCRYETLEILEENNKYNQFNRKKKFPYFKTENGILSPTGLLIAQSEKARILLPRRICKISDFKNGIAVIYNDLSSKLQCGLMNLFGDIIVDDKYKQITSITDKIFKCNNKYGAEHAYDLYFITEDYNAALIGSFDFISKPADNSIGVGVRLNKKSQDITYGIIDLEGRFILDICSSTLGKEIDEYRTITVANKVGFVHTRTKRVALISDANFIGPIHNGIASFAIGSEKDRSSNKIKGGKWGAVNKYGEVIVQPIYSKIFTDKWGRIYFCKGTANVGMINKEEQVIISDEYSFLHNDTNEKQIVFAKKSNSRHGTLYYFNDKGDLLKTEEYDEDDDW